MVPLNPFFLLLKPPQIKKKLPQIVRFGKFQIGQFDFLIFNWPPLDNSLKIKVELKGSTP